MSYKSSAFRAQPSSDATEFKYRSQVQQLQEFFPGYSVEDLQSLLLEVAGDVELAATRISEGHAEQWGSVKSKKDKKTPTPFNSHSKEHPTSRDRTDLRGTRGGRGGRGGPSRGASARGRGSARGGLVTNGHASRSSHLGKTSSPAPDSAERKAVEDLTEQASDKQDQANGISAPAHDSPSAPNPPLEPSVIDPSFSVQSTSTPSSWGTPLWGAQDPSTSSPIASKPSMSSAPKPTKPATSKLSWAQIARPQEKPAVAPLPPAAPQVPPALEPDQPAPASLIGGDINTDGEGWEDPITIQPQIWDDEPQVKPPPEDAWTLTVRTQPDVQEETPASVQEDTVTEKTVPEPVQIQSPPVEEPVGIPTPSKTPVSVAARSSVTSHRGASRHKATDRPVVMPISSFNPGLEKLGMQFGSLSLGGAVVEPTPTAPVSATEPAPVKTKQSPQQPIQSLPPQPSTRESPAATSPVQLSTTPSSQFVPPQQQNDPPSAVPPTSAPVVPAPVSLPQPQTSLTSSLSHSGIPTSVSQPIITGSPAFSQQQPQASIQPSLSHHQSQTPLPQHQAPTSHQYSHHGLSTHFDTTQNTSQQSPQHAAQPSQPQATAAHSAYFRQVEPPYFHTPTPPAGQAQDYNVFGQIGQQHPSQASHLGGFGSNDYTYGDSQRNFYESYAQSPGFGGSRNVLGHDDVKSLPASQQLPGNNVLPPTGAQTTQLPPQAGGQPQPSGGQGPQQNYPPVPYYYPYPQNQYYGTPYNSGYGVPQPFVKYPTMFQPGPPTQSAAPSPGAKQGPGSLQSQSDHYGRGLYGQQHQHPGSAYDDLGYQHHAPQHNHAPGINNLTSNEYTKHPQLYGGQAIQSFMGLSQGNAAASGPSLAQRAGGTSPEAAYKPYSQNVGVKDGGAGVSVGQGVGQPQAGRGVQQAHSQGSFYGGNRFGSSAGAGGPQAQQGQQGAQGPQGHVGYPQGNSDANFYQYQPRQHQGYWQ